MLQVTLMPWLRIREGEGVAFGDIKLSNAAASIATVADARVAERMRAITGMYREQTFGAREGAVLSDMGLLHLGADPVRPAGPGDRSRIAEFRSLLFLSCLASNARLGGNGGYMVYTTENFETVTQTFALDEERFKEVSGLLAPTTMLGLRISEARVPMPAYVNRPFRFGGDRTLLAQLEALRKKARRLFDRVKRATRVFMESYYNNPNVDLSARILLQASAFEILLDLPEKAQRRVFKERVASLLAYDGAPRVRYKYEKPGGKAWETRTIHAFWADRFYTLRNHLIHGERVPAREFEFGQQHHLVIAPLVFVAVVHRMIDLARVEVNGRRHGYDKLEWTKLDTEEADEQNMSGFRLKKDYSSLLL